MADPADAMLLVPEIRDFEQINKELLRLLSDGARHVVLAGVEGQRLLASRLKGDWTAVIEVQGRAGPELAAGLDAPNLTLICRGNAADGLASQLRAGLVAIEGDAAEGAGYAQVGGTILVRGSAGNRAGLRQRGGALFLLGDAGRLAGERRTGGTLVLDPVRAGTGLNRGASGGLQVSTGSDRGSAELRAVTARLEPWGLSIPGLPG